MHDTCAQAFAIVFGGNTVPQGSLFGGLLSCSVWVMKIGGAGEKMKILFFTPLLRFCIACKRMGCCNR